MNRPIKAIFIIAILISIFLFSVVTAYSIIENPLVHDTFEEIVAAIIVFVRNIALAVAPIILVIAGFYFLGAGGSPEKVQKAKNIVLYTAIGLFIILIAEALVYLIRNLIGVEGG